MFDQNGVKQYERTVVGIETIKGGVKAYKIKVEPRKPNTRHFKGYIWASVDGLNLVQFDGTAGENRIGLKELHTYFDAKDFGDYYCFTAGEVTARISFFIFQPERVLKFKWHATDFKPMPK